MVVKNVSLLFFQSRFFVQPSPKTLTANSFADDTFSQIFYADTVWTLGSLQTLQVTDKVMGNISIIKNSSFSGIELIKLCFRKLLGLTHNKTALKEEHRQVYPLPQMVGMERLCIAKCERFRSSLFLRKNELRASSVADPGCLSRIWIFPSRIPDLDFSVPDPGNDWPGW